MQPRMKLSMPGRPRVSHLLLAVLLTVLVKGTLWAHAALLSAEPAPGSVLTHSPARIRLVFSEPVNATVSGIRIASAVPPARDLAVRSDPHDVSAIIAPVTDSLAAGDYRVVWRTVSVDGHKVSGNFSFTVRGDTSRQASPAKVPPIPEEDTLPATATLVGAPAVAAPLRGLALACMMALAGLLFFSLRVRTSTARAWRLSFWLSIAALVVAVAHFIAWTINTAPDHQFDVGWMRALTDTSPGHMELARLAAVALATAALVIGRRPMLSFTFAMSALVISAGIGHPAAIHPLVTIPMNAIHLGAGAAWLGGLLWLIVAERDDAARYAHEARRVSTIALASVVLVVVTGIAQTLFFAGTSTAVLHTTYGKIVIVKIIGVVVLLCFGAYHRYKLMPRLIDGVTGARLRDSVRFEVGVFILVVLLGGLLAYISPHGTSMAVAGLRMPPASVNVP
jgi:copper transport protein